MAFSLRQLVRSPRLRAMGVLAWLMLVINALAAAPLGMTGTPLVHPVHATVAAVGEQHGHHRVAPAETARSCCSDQAGCGGPTSQHCACAAMCVTALPPAAAGGIATAAITARYAMPSRADTPTLATAPPLRPPAA